MTHGGADLHDQRARAGVLHRAARVRGRHLAGALRHVRRRPRPRRHRDFFLPVSHDGEPLDDEHADPPTRPRDLLSLGLLLVSLVAVVGLAKVESPAIESGVAAAGFPQSFVGVVIALLVLLPETLAAVRAARATGSRPASTSPSGRPWPASA